MPVSNWRLPTEESLDMSLTRHFLHFRGPETWNLSPIPIAGFQLAIVSCFELLGRLSGSEVRSRIPNPEYQVPASLIPQCHQGIHFGGTSGGDVRGERSDHDQQQRGGGKGQPVRGLNSIKQA